MACFRGNVEKKLYEEALKGEDTDVELKFGGPNFVVLHAHKAILVSQSNVFKVMLKDCWERKSGESNNQKTVIDLPVDDVEDFKVFLQFLYGFEPLNLEDCLLAVPAYKLADKFEALRVIQRCQDVFKSRIYREPCFFHKEVMIKLLPLSRAYGNEALFTHLINYVKKYFTFFISKDANWLDWDEFTVTDIIETDNLKAVRSRDFDWSKSEVRLLELAIGWIENQMIPRTDNSDDAPNAKTPRMIDSALAIRVLQKIRFRQMSRKDFLDCLHRLAGILTDGQIGRIALQYSDSGMGAEELVTIDGNDGHFVMDTRLREVEEDESSSSQSDSDSDSDYHYSPNDTEAE